MENTYNQKFYLSGYSLSFESSKSLFKVANAAAETNEYGIGTSLIILSSEEAIKAIMCMTKYQNLNSGVDVSIENFKDLFTKHRVKHKHIESALVLYKIRSEELKSIVDTIDNFLRGVAPSFSIPYEDLRKQYYQQLPIAIQRFETKPDINVNDILEWWKSANDWKNEGLYVDIKQGKWHDPRLTDKQRFNTGKMYLEFLIDWATDLGEFPSLNNIMNKDNN
jgi:AbiV family abortive infection protein